MSSLQPSPSPTTILIVDDEDAISGLIRTIFSTRGYDCIIYSESASALIRIAEMQDAPAATFIDLNLADGPTGILVAKVLRSRFPQSKIIFFTGAVPLDEISVLRSISSHLLKKATHSVADLLAAVAEE